MIIEQRERESEEMRIWIFITRTHERSTRFIELTITAHDSTGAFRAKNQVNVKKQMINYRASLRTQAYLYAPERHAGKEEEKQQQQQEQKKKSTMTMKKKDRTDLVSETTMSLSTTSTSPVL